MQRLQIEFSLFYEQVSERKCFVSLHFFSLECFLHVRPFQGADYPTLEAEESQQSMRSGQHTFGRPLKGFPRIGGSGFLL